MQKEMIDMTADAKVGLLLGLVFIVIIAFVVNGLPDFVHSFKTDAVVETAVTTRTNGSLVIDPAALDAARQLQSEQGLRYSRPPGQTLVLDDLGGAKTQEQNLIAAAEENPAAAGSEPPKTADQVEISRAAEAAAAARQPLPAQPANTAALTHLVQKDETLAVIAKKYYGPEEGNRLATIQKLYQANKNILESPDKVKIGDTLSIPAIKELVASPARTAAKDSPTTVLMNKFKGVFEPVQREKPSSIPEYTVRGGEHLWSIAETQLGNGRRYVEIIKLNSDRISDPDDVPAGMRLRMPKR